MKHPKYARSFEVVSELPAPLRPLRDLAYNFRWTWDHPTRDLFREIDRQLWDAVGHNPVQLISRLGADRVRKLATDSVFLARLQACAEALNQYLTESTWFDREFPAGREKTLIAYFCAEFGISESLPIYSGGLGVLAGDHLKAASDLGLPLVGVGLLYRQGFGRQRINEDGYQYEVYPENVFDQLPLRRVMGPSGPLEVAAPLGEDSVRIAVW